MEPKERLRARVVSGTPGHSRIAGITRDDDVVICTLQSAVRAYRENHAALRGFLDAAKGKLMVVFDEAHHAPAPSYTEFILALRREEPKMKLLGSDRDPDVPDEKRGGWLAKLFPQKILFEVSAARLMAQGILAKPLPIPCDTTFRPKLDPAMVQRWSATYQDIPEDIITQLAENQPRNDTIWSTYVERREEFGKTIIFADRWFQCDYLREKLRENGVRAERRLLPRRREPRSISRGPQSADARRQRKGPESVPRWRVGRADQRLPCSPRGLMFHRSRRCSLPDRQRAQSFFARWLAAHCEDQSSADGHGECRTFHG